LGDIMNESAPPKDFFAHFARHATKVRGGRLLTHALSGLGLGACVAAVFGASRFWWFAARLEQRELLLGSFAICVLGLGAGLVIGARRRFTDEDVGQYLDLRLGTDDVVTAALLREGGGRMLETVRDRAAGALKNAASTAPRMLFWRHLSLPLGVVLWLPWAWLTPPKPIVIPPPVGSEVTRLDTLDGLVALERLEGLEALDPETQRRLDAVRDQARKLEDELKTGIEKRKAQASIAELRDEVEALLGDMVSAENQAGLAAAVEELRKEDALRRAREALGEGDIVRFDQEMRKLASALEDESRKSARDALRRAEQAAAAKGARALSSALREQGELFDGREQANQWLRKLSESLPEEAARGLSQASEGKLSREQMRELVDAFDKALKSLTPEQREALGEHLREAIENGELGDAPLDQQQLQKLARDFTGEAAEQELRNMLESLAERGVASETMQGLEEAERGLSRAQQRVAGLLPLPQSSPQPGQGSSGGTPTGPGTQGGPGTGPGTGNHEGKTAPVDAPELRALAQPRLAKDVPLRGATQGRSPARPGESAHTPLGSDLSGVTADELRGVEHSNIPEEYREQVSRYFAP
jgi:hypothetical protein